MKLPFPNFLPLLVEIYLQSNLHVRPPLVSGQLP